MENKKILIVEDDFGLAEMYRMKFLKEGFEVNVSSDWADALTDISSFKPNVILLDVMMPRINGIDTLATIRSLAPNMKTKIIMFSNINNQSDVQKCMDLWADWYLIKAETTPREAIEYIKGLL